MATTYDYSKTPVQAERLHREIVAASLPAPTGIVWNSGETPYNLHITFASALTTGQQTTLAGVVTAHDGSAGTYIPPVGSMGVSGCRLAYDTTSTVKIGRAGLISRAGDKDAKGEIAFTGRLTVDITSSGAGGLDTGSVAANTWYAVFVIADSSGLKQQKGLFSLSETSPTMPAGYDLCRRIGWINTDGSSNIRRYYCQGEDTQRRYVYDAEVAALNVLSSGNATSWTQLDLSTYVPPSAEVVQLLAEVSGNSTNEFGMCRPNGSSVTYSAFALRTGPLKAAREIWYMPAPGQKIDYKVKSSSDSMDIWVAGFIDDI